MSADNIRAALQKLVNEDAEGWAVAQFVVVMGLERIAEDGSIEGTAWYWQPADQADWITGGLLDAAQDIRASADYDD